MISKKIKEDKVDVTVKNIPVSYCINELEENLIDEDQAFEDAVRVLSILCAKSRERSTLSVEKDHDCKKIEFCIFQPPRIKEMIEDEN